MWTRLDYRYKKVDHQTYYAQFVNEAVLGVVRSAIGVKAIKSSTDPHFNDIPLHRWDNIEPLIRQSIDTGLFKACNNTTYGEEHRDKFLWSLSNGVCIAKAAARIIKQGL